jgi:hypothetical protein
MKLRFDLAKKVTPEMVEEEALANQHRYKPEPRFSKTGTGSLSSASTSDSAAEAERSTARIQKLTQAANGSGSRGDKSNDRS